MPRALLSGRLWAVLLSLATFPGVGMAGPGILTRQAITALRSDAQSIRIMLDLPDGRTEWGQLARFELFREGAQLVAEVDGGSVALERPDVLLWRGRLEGDPGSLIYMAAVPDRVTGFIRTADETWEVAPDAAGLHRIYTPSVPPTSRPKCDFDRFKGALERPRATARSAGRAPGATPEAEVAIDVDQSLYTYLGSTSAAAAYVTSLFGAVSTIYERDVDVILTISYLRVWSTADPYSNSSSYDALMDFQSYWRANMGSVTRDIAHLISRAGFGGIAYLDVLCDRIYGYAVSGIDGYYSYPNPNYTWDADVVSHETGHNFASPHTHCYVPEIDRCYNQEPGCYSGPVQPQIGTIMSYCHLVMGKVLTFSSREQDVIESAAASAPCIAAPCGTIVLSPSSLPGGAVGQSYSQTLSATGGTGPYTFSRTSGTLPPGLSLSTAGVISGTPTSAGSYTLTVTATDSVGCTGSHGYGIVIACGALAITPDRLPVGLTGVSYSQQLQATGGSYPYTFTLASGSLPAGLTLSTSGLISGTPSTPGFSSFTVNVMDASGCSGGRAYSIAIACPILTLAPETLLSATEGAFYTQTFTPGSGQPPYSFSLSSGSLPTGITIDAAGTLSGTPTGQGLYRFGLLIQDQAGCSLEREYSLVVNGAGCPALTLAPTSLPVGTIAVPYSATVTASGGTAPYTYAIAAGSLPPGLSLSPTGSISGTPIAAGVFDPLVVATDAASCMGSHIYALAVGRPENIVVGEGLGPPNESRVRVVTVTGTAALDFLAYSAGGWGVNVASGDVDGGSYDEILTGPGPGLVYGPQVRAFDSAGMPLLKINFYAYSTLRYGVNASSGGVDGDAYAEILSGAGPGSVFGPHVRGWDFDASAITGISKISFFAYGTLRYGVNVAGGSVDGDSFSEILTGPGPGFVFGPQVRGFNYDGTGLSAISKINFNAFSTPTSGVNLASGDVDADGFDEIATTPGPGPALDARFRGYDYDGSAVAPASGYDILAYGTKYGGRVGLGDVGADGADELLAAPGRDPVAAADVRAFAYDGATLWLLPDSFDAFPGITYGVNVAGGNLGY